MKKTRGILTLLAAVIGATLMAWGFVTGVSAALDGSGNGADVYVAVFFFGGALVLAALVFAIVHLIRGGSKPLAWITIVIGMLPLLAVVVLAVQARG